MNFNRIAALAVIISHMLISFAVMSHHHGSTGCCSESCSIGITEISGRILLNSDAGTHHQCLFCRSIDLFQKDFQINFFENNSFEHTKNITSSRIPDIIYQTIIPSNGRSPPLS